MECLACRNNVAYDINRKENYCGKCGLSFTEDKIPITYDSRFPYRRVRRNGEPTSSYQAGELMSKNPEYNPANQLILTCPHAQCNIPKEEYDIHLRDWIAEDALNGIIKHLDNEPNTIFFIGRDRRAEWDLNRTRSRIRPFREAVAEKVGKGDIHLDVHSYPHTDKTDNWYEYDLVIFVHGNEKMVFDIVDELKSEDYTVLVLPADKINDVANHCTEMGAASTLIEFNSELKETGRLDGACKAVAKAVKHYRRGVHG